MHVHVHMCGRVIAGGAVCGAPSPHTCVAVWLQAEEFVAQAFDAETLRVYRSFPLAVMKADFWRYAILYARGGVYADIDVQARRPVASWLPPVDGSVSELAFAPYYKRLSWDQCKVVIGLENDAHFCQWVSVGRCSASVRVGQGSRGVASSRHAGVWLLISFVAKQFMFQKATSLSRSPE